MTSLFKTVWFNKRQSFIISNNISRPRAKEFLFQIVSVGQNKRHPYFKYCLWGKSIRFFKFQIASKNTRYPYFKLSFSNKNQECFLSNCFYRERDINSYFKSPVSNKRKRILIPIL